MDLEDDFQAMGWLNALPDQYGIPGWMRITFMKHFAENLNDVDSDNLWAYEGVVLPGGRIIVGRWWFASHSVNFDVSAGLQVATQTLIIADLTRVTTTDRSFCGLLSLMMRVMSSQTATQRSSTTFCRIGDLEERTLQERSLLHNGAWSDGTGHIDILEVFEGNIASGGSVHRTYRMYLVISKGGRPNAMRTTPVFKSAAPTILTSNPSFSPRSL